MDEDWKILGIEPTQDLAELKKAYARALRIYRPDKDPEGFRKLRESYERLISVVQSGYYSEDSEEDIEDVSHQDKSSTFQESSNVEQSNLLIDVPITPPEPDPVQVLFQEWLIFCADLQQKSKIYWNAQITKKVYDVALWKAFMKRDELWDLRIRTAFEWRLLIHLRDDLSEEESLCQMMPYPVWHDLDKLFDWSHREFQLSQWLAPPFLTGLLERVHEARRRAEGGFTESSEERDRKFLSLTDPELVPPVPSTDPIDTLNQEEQSKRKIPVWGIFVIIWVLAKVFGELAK